MSKDTTRRARRKRESAGAELSVRWEGKGYEMWDERKELQ